ncbi:FGGY-family carbohydrate kinase [Candidatus Thiothrix sp. Deng01]|uniref:FGGY-family carbohydrate kinase n=1 Tax=Candidatus Thiothrix phosphatis TaxID=3112415 RepID=A0ABU6CT08_9GAMM|nr:FGGY-family carbohydrate kinase [Candidatus Thiothrix sp. Deng01]MEB4589538.1 FGGY-family carbohydrate kinase [Candidatus Thiothrix sp. Deng01]
MGNGDPANACYAGIDLGTSGCRVAVIDAAGGVLAATRVDYPANVGQTPELWWAATRQVLAALPDSIHANLQAIAVDGTSSSILLTDRQGDPTTPALMYNDARAVEQSRRIAGVAPRESGAHGATSSLAKLLWLLEHYPGLPHAHALHQADWIAGKLAGHFSFSDANNCLKLGFDPVRQEWPEWVKKLVPEYLLPTVYLPGEAVPSGREEVGEGLLPHVVLRAGTTDSIAAFIATGASAIGDAVTSLGSTIALKIISDQPVFAPEYGVYSHRLGEMWLAGGASNSGGAVLLHFFPRAELERLTPQLRPGQPVGLDYYPLTQPGERFPHADPQWQPRLTPRPVDDVQFLQAMLEGMSRIEHAGWRKLHELGAPYPVTLRTVGGGSGNPAWMRMRQQMIGVPMPPAHQHGAAYGAALLALHIAGNNFPESFINNI